MNEYDQLNYRIYTQKSESDKAINSLKGILIGIGFDEEITVEEINELDLWVTHHQNLINKNPFNEFMTIIKETITGRLPSKESIEDLFWLCQKYEGDNYYYNSLTTDLQTLQGLCHGILADGKITADEINNLDQWLKENEHLTSYYPYDEIRALVLSIVADHKIDENERLKLKAFINQFVKIKDDGVSQQIHQETAGVNISSLCTSDPNVVFDGSVFCITGILKRGDRNQTSERIRHLGGIIVDNITKKTDYLIVGDHGNPAWAYACYGRKVEKALSLRKEGHNIMLIHEFDFFDILDDFN